MKRNKESAKLFQLLNDEELKKLFWSIERDQQVRNVSRGFIIHKLQEIPEKELLRNDYVSNLLKTKLIQAMEAIKLILKQLDKDELIKMYKDFGRGEIVTDKMKKSKIIEKMIMEIPLPDILKNKRFRAKLKPKQVPLTHLKSLQKEIGNLKKEVDKINQGVEILFEKISEVSRGIRDLSIKLELVENLFNVESAPDLYVYLKAVYDEIVATDGRLIPEVFPALSEKIREKLEISENTFILKGLELLLLHYLLTNVKSLHWRPSFEEFWKILKDEFEKVKILENQAEIPTLRDHVCKRMGISEDMFDELLIEAADRDYVKLDVGRPIGEYDVKYLTTKDGLKFYYVKLLR